MSTGNKALSEVPSIRNTTYRLHSRITTPSRETIDTPYVDTVDP